MKINQDFIMREIAGEYILVPTGNTALQFNGLITVNEIGAVIWEKLQQGISREKLVQAMLEEYEADEAELSADVDEFLNQLSRAGVIE